MSVMDVNRPIGSLCRGVEGDVLDVLVTSHLSQTGSTIAARCGRSKSEVWKALRHLESAGVVLTHRDEGGTWHSLRSDSPVTSALLRFADVKHDFADDVRQHLAKWDPAPLSATLGTSAWARRIGVGTVIIIVTTVEQLGSPWPARLRHHLRTRLGHTVQVVTGTTEDVREFLCTARIDHGDPWDRPTHITGIPLGQAVDRATGGTGGI